VKISREVKIGAVFIVTLAFLIWGLNFLKGKNVFSRQRVFYAIYDRVDGLVTANPVNVNGMKIGQVSDLYFASDSSARIVVKLAVKSDLLIPDNSIARIYSEDLMGDKAIAIVLGTSKRYAQSGDTLKNEIEESLKEEVNKQVLPIKKKAEDLISSIDSLVGVIQYVFNAEMRADLIASVRSIKQTIGHLETTSQVIDTLVQTQQSRFATIIANITSITDNLNNNNEDISRIIHNFSAISDTIARARVSETLKNTNQTLKDVSTVLTKIDRGEGTLGMLINDDSLYVHLNSSARDLDMLLRDIRMDPNRYVHFSIFGKKDKETKKSRGKSSE